VGVFQMLHSSPNTRKSQILKSKFKKHNRAPPKGAHTKSDCKRYPDFHTHPLRFRSICARAARRKPRWRPHDIKYDGPAAPSGISTRK